MSEGYGPAARKNGRSRTQQKPRERDLQPVQSAQRAGADGPERDGATAPSGGRAPVSTFFEEVPANGNVPANGGVPAEGGSAAASGGAASPNGLAAGVTNRGRRVWPVRPWREVPLWKDVTDAEWHDWRWQLKNRITTLEQLEQIIRLTPAEREGITKGTPFFQLSITPYYASLMDPDDPHCPVRLQAVPLVDELMLSPFDMDDPLQEHVDSPVPFLTHRYPDRVLFLITDQCPLYCRHCTRRWFTSQENRARTRDELDAAIAYIAATPAVRDVLISGGDGLNVGDERLEYVLSRLRAIEHVEIIRIGSRVPVVNPMRVTPALCAMLRKYHPVWLNTHFNHPKELTPEARRACEMLADAGVPLGNQTVLLRGVNDCPIIMKELVHKCVMARVRPYYLYQCDLSQGLEHFRTPIAKGIEIMEHLRGHTSGYCVPTYVVDAPGGGGKIPVGPNYVVSQGEGKVVLRNFEGGLFVYHEPKPRPREAPGAPREAVRLLSDGHRPQARIQPEVCPVCGTDHAEVATGIGRLLQDRETSLVPEGTERLRRRAAIGHAEGADSPVRYRRWDPKAGSQDA